MRLAAYFILAYVALGLQLGLGDYGSYAGASPNLVLLAVVFIAVNARRDAALLGCFSMGVMQDLLTRQPPGLYALSYGLVALAVSGAAGVVHRAHPLTHLSMAFVGGLITAGVLLLHGWVHPAAPPVEAETPTAVAAGASLPAIRLDPMTEFARVIYTAVLAPLVLGVLQRFKRAFSFQAPHPKIRAY